MKHIYFYIMVILLSFSNFGMIIHAQSPCESVSVEVIAMNPQSGPHNYFGVRVSVSQPHYQNITVSGYIWNGPDEHGYNEDHPYTLTIVAGYLTAETPVTFFETSPAAEGAANITSVSPCPETESEEIVLSSPFQNLLRLRNEFLDKIDTAVSHGISLDSIKAAALSAIINDNYQSIYSKLFSDSTAGATFFDSISTAKDALIETYPLFEEHPEIFTCQTCESSWTGKINYFFNNFSVFNTYRYSTQTSGGPTCGSWWQQVKLGGCAFLCSLTTAGLGTVLCGWGCWCMLCNTNSAVYDLICE